MFISFGGIGSFLMKIFKSIGDSTPRLGDTLFDFFLLWSDPFFAVFGSGVLSMSLL